LFYDDGPFSLCRFIASIKRTFKKNKNPAETHSEALLFTTQLLDDERERGAASGFSNRLWKRKTTTTTIPVRAYSSSL
jgi:hypothetical protein